MVDTCFFEELDNINDADLRNGLWNVVCIYFTGRKNREQALAGAENIVDLYTKPVVDNLFRGIPRQPADHYRTRAELMTVAKAPNVMDALVEYGLIELHPQWPFAQRSHPQAPYRPVVERFMEIRQSAMADQVIWD